MLITGSSERRGIRRTRRGQFLTIMRERVKIKRMQRLEYCKNGHWMELSRRPISQKNPTNTVCGICKRERDRKWRKSNPIKSNTYNRSKHLKANYGITIKEYEDILKNQGGRCVICGEKPNGKRRAPVDHDHEINKVRGILCQECNTGIGLFKENISNFENAIRYLNIHKLRDKSILNKITTYLETRLENPRSDWYREEAI